MKTLSNKLFLILTVTGILFSATGWSQDSKEISKEQRELPSFTGIEVGGAFDVYLSQGDKQEVIVETNTNLLSKVKTKVSDNTLHLTSDRLRKITTLKVYITAQNISNISVSGAATVKSKTSLSNENMFIEASGAADIDLEIATSNLSSEISGAADMKLTGTADNHESTVSGAATLKAINLATTNTTIEVSGAADATVSATNEIQSNVSGAATLNYFDKPGIKRITSHGNYTVKFTDIDTRDILKIKTSDNGDSTTVKVGNIKVKVVDDDDVEITLGNSKLIINDDDEVEFIKKKKHKFNGHWGGFEMGINGFLNNDHNMDLPLEYDFLDLRMEKSIQVALNLYEQNFNLVNNHLGLVTGLGIEYNNYRFDDDVILDPKAANIAGAKNIDADKNYTKSKLVVNWLNVPLLLEYQTNRYSKSNSFHITTGIIGGVRIGSHSKNVVENGGKEKPKKRDDFHLSPFKADATVRIGWGVINLYANYSLTEMFRTNRGPVLHPFAVGITLVGW